MFRSIKRAGVLLVIASALVVALSGAALAAGLSDLPQSLLDKYGLTAAEVSAFSQGFPDGTWRPDQMVTRAQFTKMAIDAFKIAQADPATPSFTDVAPDNMYYRYIESARAAGLVTGMTAAIFEPYATLTHQQGYVIVMRWVAKTAGSGTGLLGDAPAMAMGNLYQATAQALGGALHADGAMTGSYPVHQTGQPGETISPAAGTTRIQAAAALIRTTRWLQTR